MPELSFHALVIPSGKLTSPTPCIYFLSFSAADSTGNLLKTEMVIEFNLLLSRHCFSCVPSVLLLLNSSLENN